MSKFVIDGFFLTQRITGIQRYAYELIKELDKIIPSGTVEILIPNWADAVTEYSNIKTVRYGNLKGLLWEQVNYAHYVKKNRAECICLTNTIPLTYPKGIVTIHDISYKVNPQFFTSKRDRLSALWHRLNYRKVAKSKMSILTVSEFSKSEIEKYYKVPDERINVIYNGWQHTLRIPVSEETYKRFPQLNKGDYYFSMSTIAPNKNFKWILYAAKNNPDKLFAIAGGGKLKGVAEALGFKELPNVHFLGYVSDEDAKTLMRDSKAFVFPSLYEGFGIPPLEAISCGAERVVISDTPCMHEIYGNTAEYINPTDYENAKMLEDGRKVSKDILEKYSWKESAEKLKEIMFWNC